MNTIQHSIKHPASIDAWWKLAMVLAAWLGLDMAIVFSGILARPESPPYLMLIFATLPLALFLIAYRASSALRSWAMRLDTGALVGIHTWRMLGMSFLFLYFFDLLPAGFAIPAGLGDAAAALGATWIVLTVARRAPLSRRALLGWNLFGIADFVVAFSMGTLLQSRFFGGASNTDIMGAFPLVLIPLFIVPLLTISHLIIALQIHHRTTTFPLR